MNRPVITIVGGGASGTLLTVQLLRQARIPIEIKWVESAPEFGRGIAYQKSLPQWVLNVPAGKMSALPDDPDHFYRWLQQYPVTNSRRSYQPGDFVPREIYGEYLSSLWQRSQQDASHVHLQPLHHRVHHVVWKGESGEVFTESGDHWPTDYLVLAVGNFPPAPPATEHGRLLGPDYYIGNPWTDRWPKPENLKTHSILILGSGLTAMDTIQRLRATGFPGRILLVARRELLPQVHHPSPPFGSLANFLGAVPTLRQTFRALRWAAKQAEAEGGNWRAVIDAIRPRTADLWQGFSFTERQRFLRHARPYWEVHRHRIPPSLGEELGRWVESGEVEVVAGRVISLVEEDREVKAEIILRGTERRRVVTSGLVINCSGPDVNFQRVTDRLARNLCQSGLTCPHHLGWGWEAKADGRLINNGGSPHNRIFTLGPPLKVVLWESTAIAEIRQQAQALAERLLACIDHRFGDKSSTSIEADQG